jgi:hypothetical protein
VEVFANEVVELVVGVVDEEFDVFECGVLADHFDDEDETLPQNGDFFVLRAALGAAAVPMTQEWVALAPVDVAALVPSEECVGVLMWVETFHGGKGKGNANSCSAIL